MEFLGCYNSGQIGVNIVFNYKKKTILNQVKKRNLNCLDLNSKARSSKHLTVESLLSMEEFDIVLLYLGEDFPGYIEERDRGGSRFHKPEWTLYLEHIFHRLDNS